MELFTEAGVKVGLEGRSGVTGTAALISEGRRDSGPDRGTAYPKSSVAEPGCELPSLSPLSCAVKMVSLWQCGLQSEGV